MLKQESNKFQNWLAYTPLLYNQLFMFPTAEIKQISTLKWLQTSSSVKSSFKFQEGHICVGGATSKTSKSNNCEGGFAIYKVLLPTAEELDDDRLNPTVKFRSYWRFQEEIDLIEQYPGRTDPESNMFAVTYRKQPTVCLIPTAKLTKEGTHSEYAEMQAIKLEGHKLPITCLKWGNFGMTYKVFTSSLDSTIIQWDIQKKVLQRQLAYHKSSVQALTPLVDPSYIQGDSLCTMQTLASASTDGTILIWDRKSPTPVTKINPGQKQLSAIDCFSKHMLVSGGEEGSIKIMDLRHTRQYLYDSKNDKVPGHTAKIKQIKVSRHPTPETKAGDSKIIERIKFTTSAHDNKIIEWQQKIQFVHEGHENTPTFDISDRNKLCASAEVKKNVVMLWESGVSLSQNQH